MKNMIGLSLIFAVVLLVGSAFAVAGNQPPTEGGVLPDIELPVPENPAQRQYLGLAVADGAFKIPDIQAEVVIIEIFSMY